MGQKDLRRKTPIMGWASWNCFRTNISEEKLKKQADALVSTGLAECGYEYFNIDDGFFGGRDENGRLQFHKERFPNGIKVLADYAHSLGLKAGIYAEGGDMTCGYYYDNEGSNGSQVGLYGHEEQDLSLYLEECGFDFLKVDWCGGLRMGLSEQEQYTKIGNIIEEIRQRTGKPIVYNVCRWQFPGPWVTEIADSWRTAADIEPDFSSILHQLDNIKPLAKYCGPGHVNDLDMMQIGNGLSPEEERTHFAMWCMLSTPLMIGCDMTKLAPETLELLKNKELIAIHQDSACQQAFVIKELRSEDGAFLGEIWIKNLGAKNSARKAVAFLNRSESPLTFQTSMEELGLKGKLRQGRSIWQQEQLTEEFSFTVGVKAHGVEVLVLEAEDFVEIEDKYEKESFPDPETPFLTEEEAGKLLAEGALLVDVRTKEEYEKEHLPGAVNLPYTDIHGAAPKVIPDRARSIIVYCKTGKRSTQAKQSLIYLGYKKVYSWKQDIGG